MLGKIGILVIGDELLVGQTLDTNAFWLGQQFSEIGQRIAIKTTVSDTKEAILGGLEYLQGQCELVIATGGLGPTKDDITKRVLCDYFGDSLVLDSEIEQKIRDAFEIRGVTFLDVHKQQAMVPLNGEVLPNTRGTASGMWFSKKGLHLISLPGVPAEMRGLITDEVIPRIQAKWGMGAYFHHTILTAGIGESSLAHQIEHWEDHVRMSGFDLAYLPRKGSVKLRLGISLDNHDLSREKVLQEMSELKALIPEWYVGEGGFAANEILVKRLIQRGETISVAESCTGGGFMQSITEIPGSSKVFKGGVVVYSNDLKSRALGVGSAVLEQLGAVSGEVAEAMAKGLSNNYIADIQVSITGIAGPESDDTQKPVGLVYFCAVQGDVSTIWEKKFPGSRSEVRSRAIQHLTAELIRKFL
ncbi:MAG: nicotinamide-nucleotide amidase [Sphingobacteriales bacterium]